MQYLHFKKRRPFFSSGDEIHDWREKEIRRRHHQRRHEVHEEAPVGRELRTRTGGEKRRRIGRVACTKNKKSDAVLKQLI